MPTTLCLISGVFQRYRTVAYVRADFLISRDFAHHDKDFLKTQIRINVEIIFKKETFANFYSVNCLCYMPHLLQLLIIFLHSQLFFRIIVVSAQNNHSFVWESNESGIFSHLFQLKFVRNVAAALNRSLSIASFSTSHNSDSKQKKAALGVEHRNGSIFPMTDTL